MQALESVSMVVTLSPSRQHGAQRRAAADLTLHGKPRAPSSTPKAASRASIAVVKLPGQASVRAGRCFVSWAPCSGCRASASSPPAMSWAAAKAPLSRGLGRCHAIEQMDVGGARDGCRGAACAARVASILLNSTASFAAHLMQRTADARQGREGARHDRRAVQRRYLSLSSHAWWMGGVAGAVDF